MLTHVACVLFPQVMQKQTLGELGIWTAIWWLVVWEIFIPKTNKISLFFFQVIINNVTDIFWAFFVYFNADFMGFDFPG